MNHQQDTFKKLQRCTESALAVGTAQGKQMQTLEAILSAILALPATAKSEIDGLVREARHLVSDADNELDVMRELSEAILFPATKAVQS